MIIGTDLKKSASNLKPSFSATTIFWWWDISMWFMTTKALDYLYWFEEVCFESETTSFCNTSFIIVKRLSVVHDSQSIGTPVLIWRGLLQIWNQRFLLQPFSFLWNISMLSMRAKAYHNRYWFEEVCFSSETNGIRNNHFWLWDVSMLSVSARNLNHRYWFEEVCFECETNGFCNNHFLIAKRLSVVHDNQNLGTSVLIWQGLLLIWNHRYLQHPFSYGETSRCCPWQPKPMIIGTDLGRSASNLKPAASATTFWSLLRERSLSWSPAAARNAASKRQPPLSPPCSARLTLVTLLVGQLV